jgi:hypothetical protein
MLNSFQHPSLPKRHVTQLGKWTLKRVQGDEIEIATHWRGSLCIKNPLISKR